MVFKSTGIRTNYFSGIHSSLLHTLFLKRNKNNWSSQQHSIFSLTLFKGSDSLDILEQNYRRLPSLFTNSIEAQQSGPSVVLFKEKSDYSKINTHFAEGAKKQNSLNFGKPMNKLSNLLILAINI